MPNMKKTKKYYFTVEGETEQWYLQWLENTINSTESALYKVSISCPVNKNPAKYAKSLTVTDKMRIYHISDYESDEEEHVKEFIDTMDNMKKAMSLGKQITYKFGYSNFTFDLWMVLHRVNCNSCLTHRSQYLQYINRAYGESFTKMDHYKSERNFKRCLSKLDLSSVKDAIERAKTIMANNKANGYVLHEYKGFNYYKENPSLLIWEAIEAILKDCKLY